MALALMIEDEAGVVVVAGAEEEAGEGMETEVEAGEALATVYA